MLDHNTDIKEEAKEKQHYEHFLENINKVISNLYGYLDCKDYIGEINVDDKNLLSDIYCIQYENAIGKNLLKNTNKKETKEELINIIYENKKILEKYEEFYNEDREKELLAIEVEIKKRLTEKARKRVQDFIDKVNKDYEKFESESKKINSDQSSGKEEQYRYSADIGRRNGRKSFSSKWFHTDISIKLDLSYEPY